MEEACSLEQRVNEEMQAMHTREDLIQKRVDALKIIHEHIIVIQRMDNIDTLTFLELAEKSVSNRRRASWYGKVLRLSPLDCGDDVIEKKKKLVQVGDIVSFNPETAYSLNITGFEEIWILHMDNILVVDTEFDYVKAREENLRKRMDIQQAMAAQRMQQIMAVEQAQKIQQAQSKMNS